MERKLPHLELLHIEDSSLFAFIGLMKATSKFYSCVGRNYQWKGKFCCEVLVYIPTVLIDKSQWKPPLNGHLSFLAN